MNKIQAKTLLGGTGADVARRLGITRSAVSRWPDPLPPRVRREVIGAAVEQGLVTADNFARVLADVLVVPPQGER